MADNVFAHEEEQLNQNDSSGDDKLQDKINELKGKSVDDLAKGKAHADQFIEFLKEQNAGLKSELEQRLNAEKVLEELKLARQKPEASEERTNSGLNTEDIKSLVAESIVQENQKKIVESNILTVDKAVRGKFGEKAKEFVANKANELGMGLDDLAAIAAKSPMAFFNLVGLTDVKSVSSAGKVSESTINSEALNNRPNNLAIGTNGYYQELRRSNPSKFYDPAVQKQMFEDRKRLGTDFYK